MTWVVSDYVAAQGSAELSVQKGQQVEVIDTNCLGAPDYCLVRLTNVSTNNNNVSTTSLSSSSTQEQIIHEGLVPSSILKPPPTQTSKNRRAGDAEEGKFHFPLRLFNFMLSLVTWLHKLVLNLAIDLNYLNLCIELHQLTLAREISQ